MSRKIISSKISTELSHFRLLLFTIWFSILMPLGFIYIAFIFHQSCEDIELGRFLISTSFICFFIIYIPAVILFFVVDIVRKYIKRKPVVFFMNLVIMILACLYFLTSIMRIEYGRSNSFLIIFLSLIWSLLSTWVMFKISTVYKYSGTKSGNG